jgi:pimeloyl-ACP methyl ester carboxylesterase
MNLIRYLSDKTSLADTSGRTLIVMLPGANHAPEGFIEHGFVSAVRERQLPLDLLMAELPFSHIADTSAIDALHEQVISPAKEAGYANVWIAGISIGAYMAIAFENRYPGLLSGLTLLAPYPGNRITTNEIAAAGGIKQWTPEAIAEDDTERHNWLWLKHHSAANPKIYLGYGDADRFAAGHAMMATLLPAHQVDVVAGDHVWPVWQILWQRFLDKEFGLIHA